MTAALWGDRLALANACLNGTSFILLFAGWRAIRSGRVLFHRNCMTAAFGVSALFLASYLTRFALTGTHRYPGIGAIRTVYLTILFSHTFLAATVPFLAIRTFWLALRKRFDDHKKIARVTLPIWMYVSVTGVIVYLMLYRF